MTWLIAVAVVGILLVSCEIYWRRRSFHQGEFTRKFIHITVGSFVAFWPFWLSWNHIRLLSLSFLVVVAVSKYLHLFQAIHSVQRPTWGEVFFAVSVGLITFITTNKWIYATALLQMSVADGLAAVMGSRFGNGHRYSVFGHPKSLIGSLTFFVMSLLLLVGYSHYGAAFGVRALAMLTLSVAATIIENVGVGGLDNLFVPVLIAISLRLMTG